jgi:hypothetical protein
LTLRYGSDRSSPGFIRSENVMSMHMAWAVDANIAE